MSGAKDNAAAPTTNRFHRDMATNLRPKVPGGLRLSFRCVHCWSGITKANGRARGFGGKRWGTGKWRPIGVRGHLGKRVRLDRMRGVDVGNKESARGKC